VEYLLPQKDRRYVVGRINLIGADRCMLSIDRNRIFWQEKQLKRFQNAVLHSIAAPASRLLEAFEKQDDPSDIQLKIIQQRFRAFVRTSILRADLVDSDFVSITESHGFHHKWQKMVVDNIARSFKVTETGHHAE
jgi:hypothetical protein